MLNVVVTSAIELSSSQMDKVKKEVTKKYGKDVNYIFSVDPSLVAGVTITVNSRQFDGSVKYKLEQMKKALDENLA
jgi:F-type H+-transporting ATPase subunit delta